MSKNNINNDWDDYQNKIFNISSYLGKLDNNFKNETIIDSLYNQKFKLDETKICNLDNVDATLIEPYRDVRMKIDRNPMNSCISSNGVYHEKLNNYGNLGNFVDYKDLEAGQIMYYNTNEKKEGYFSNEMEMSREEYTDPMGSTSYEYSLPDEKREDEDLPQWLKDSQNHREEIIKNCSRRKYL